MGLGVKSIKRFCQTYGIKKKRFLSEDECSDEAVASCYRPYNKYYVYELLDRCAIFLLPESVHKYGWTSSWSQDDEGAYQWKRRSITLLQ